jgi:hypothetical protein
MLKNRKQKNSQQWGDFTLLLLEIPRTNDKKELAAEQMYAALHGILKPKRDLWRDGGTGQEHISFEIAAIDKRIRFYVWVPTHLKTFVEGQIYAQYPTAQIHELSEDYATRKTDRTISYSTELTLTDLETLPIRTFITFEVDPLASITATLAKLEDPGEEMWIQVLMRPISDEWHKQSAKTIQKIKSGQSNLMGGAGNMLGQAMTALVKPPTYDVKSSEKELSDRDKTRIAAIQEKSVKLGYQVKIRIIYFGKDETTARVRMQGIVGSFKQFNSTNLNGFESKIASFDKRKIDEYKQREFGDSGFILNIEELASVFHLPHTSVETPNIVWATTKTAEPPSNLPVLGNHKESEISLFGVSNFRGNNSVFGILRSDRGRHLYTLGQTGAGKSKLLELLTLSDIYYDQGFAIVDPHGDYATSMLSFIPDRRIDDVVYFNPADTAYPIGFNPLEVTDPALKSHISSELVGVMKRMFDSWGPRLEYILRYTLLALLDYPNSTMLDITRMLTEKDFRNEVISYCEDPVVKNFWVGEFASWNDKFATEAVAPVLNKVGAFTANPMVRNIIGQPKGGFNIRKIMDEGKILVVNLSRGLVGEDNAAILGAMMVTKIQLAAMSRADIAKVEDRRPFYLYVDEFQNFATDSFAVILSEARKYGLCLTVANQYISQMDQVVRDAVFGNVGSIISFRVSPDDAPFLQKYFEPQFEAADLIQLHARHFVTSMMISGEKTPAFSATSLMVPKTQKDNSAAIMELSRQRYAKERSIVEDAIKASTSIQQHAPQAPKPNHQAPAPQNKPNYRQQAPQYASQRAQPPRQNTQQPAQTTPLGSAAIGSVAPVHAQPTTDNNDQQPKKRRRIRTRRRKAQNPNPQEQHQVTQPAQQSQTPTFNNNDTINLR